MKKKIGFTMTLFASLLATGIQAEAVRECGVPRISTLAVNDGKLTRISDTGRHRFREGDQILFQVEGAFTGIYTVLYYSAGQSLQIDEFTYLDPNKSYMLPCGYSFTASCDYYALEVSEQHRKYDDFVLLYTPCFSGNSVENGILAASLSKSDRQNIPRCGSGFSVNYSEAEISRVLENQRTTRGCDVVTDRRGRIGVVKRMPIEIR